MKFCQFPFWTRLLKYENCCYGESEFENLKKAVKLRSDIEQAFDIYVIKLLNLEKKSITKIPIIYNKMAFYNQLKETRCRTRARVVSVSLIKS